MVWDTAHRITFSSRSNTRIVNLFILVAVVIIGTFSLTWMLTGAWAGLVSSQELVVIDTDPGIDDAVAIFTVLGDPTIKVLGITCVRGNTGVPNVVINALKILKISQQQQIPVYSGSNYGLITSLPSDDWFGVDGFGDLPFPNPPSPLSAEKEHAGSFLARIVMEYPGQVTVVCIGPLTNVAVALHLNPNFLIQVKQLIIMGGSVRGYGNAAPGVDFNFHQDPDAAALVLERALLCNVTVTLVPLETCRDYDLTQAWRWNTMAKINNSVMRFLNAMERKHLQRHPTTSYYPYDSFATTAILDSEFVVSSKELYGFVENTSQRSRGALFLDHANTTRNAANLEVVMEINSTLLKNKLIENLSNFT